MSTLYPVIGNPRIVGKDMDLPEEVRRESGICDGEMVVLRKSPEGLLITVIDPDQRWFWTPEWQEGEREVEMELADGKPRTIYYNEAEFFEALARIAASDDPDINDRK